MLDIGLAEFVAMVWMVHGKFMPVQRDAETRAVARVDACAKMMEQRLDFTPLNIAAQRVVEYCLKDIPVLVAHGAMMQISGVDVNPKITLDTLSGSSPPSG